MQKWNYKTLEYEEYTVPDDWKVRTFSIDMDEKVNCAACGKSIGLMFEPSIEYCSLVLGDYKTKDPRKSYEGLQQKIIDLMIDNLVLEKALNRACEELGNSRGCPIEHLKMDNDGEIDCNYENHDCKKCWRDYLMKGENE